MESFKITYRFLFTDARVREYEIEIDRATGRSKTAAMQAAAPEWAALEHKKCSHCPLNATEYPQCPVAHSLAAVADDFKSEKSFEKVAAEVVTKERIYRKDIALQEGLFGLFGLLMATSACPYFGFLRPMAMFHLPFSSLRETMVRSVSFYLLKQYFVAKKGGKPDFELADFSGLYSQVEKVNIGIIERIRSISKADAEANSIVILDGFAKLLGFQVTDGLPELEDIFNSNPPEPS